MGILDLFGSREQRNRAALRKLAQKITQRYGPPENRQKAIEQLAGMGTPAALGTLCLRFTVRADVGITDDEEKETVRRLLVEAGPDAVEPVREFLKAQESGVSWGLRVLASLLSPDEVLNQVVALLDRAGKVYSRDPEKKLVLLSWLTEHHAPPAPARGPVTPSAASPEGERSRGVAIPTALEGAILPLLEDFSDDVRISGARALAGLGAGEAGRAALVELLLRDRDNARVRGEVLQALCDLGADVKGHRPAVEALPLDPFFLDREGRVKKRG